MKLITLILSLTLGFATTAFSNSKFDNWTYSDLPPISVAVDDQATGGCWTNIGEVKTYAEDKLRMAGADVIETAGASGTLAPGAALLAIRVKTERNNAVGFCWGFMSMDLVIGSKKDNMLGLFTYANTAATLMRNSNVNNDVLDLVGRVVSRWGSNN